VRLRLEGLQLREITARTRLSAPTIIAAHKAYLTGGWAAVDVRPRGRTLGDGRALNTQQERALLEQLTLTPGTGVETAPSLWSAETIAERIATDAGLRLTDRAIAYYLSRWRMRLPRPNLADAARSEWRQSRYPAIAREARASGSEVLWIRDREWPAPGAPAGAVRLLYAVSNRGRARWWPYRGPLQASTVIAFLTALQADSGRPLTLLLEGLRLERVDQVQAWLRQARLPLTLVDVPTAATPLAPRSAARPPPPPTRPSSDESTMNLTHLQRLEADSIHVMREVVAEANNPVMLYSIGKDSAVMLHLAMKAFYPARPPFPLLHVDTLWKFREMYEFRDRIARELGLDLIVHVNPEGRAQGINPFTHGSAIHTDVMKTQGLRQALDQYGFDAAFGGARRDEEKSRAKERIFSFRSVNHRWDPKSQRPELWHLYNARKHKGESMRVFPLSNWTELDIWQYIHLENIPLVPLYFSKPRPVVERDGTLIMVDDDRMPLKEGEVPTLRNVRFRTLGCYPLTGAIESTADTLPAIIQEMLLTKTSERQGRVIDHDQAASMERKKQEGYF
jgi:sulfate adenylyltransferase subunit 2